MNKRGMNHVEMMLSFLIFIGFVIFALYFFSPAQTTRLVESSLSYATREINKNTSVELESYSVSLNLAGWDPGQTSLAVELPSNLENAEVRVENYLGEVIPSERNGDIIYFARTNVDYPDEINRGFVMIKLSEDFEPYSGGIDEGGAESGRDSIASSNTAKLLSEKRFLELKRIYDGEYNSLKTSFNLPDRVEFGFSLVFDENDKINAERSVLKGREVFSERERVEVLRANGQIQFADLLIKIW